MIDGAQNPFYLSGLWQENRLSSGRINRRSLPDLFFLQIKTHSSWPHVGRYSERDEKPSRQERELVKPSESLKRGHGVPSSTLNSLLFSFVPGNVSAGHSASCRSGYLRHMWFDNNQGHNDRFRGQCSPCQSYCKMNRPSMSACQSPPFDPKECL